MPITIKDVFEAMPGRFQPEAAGDWNTKIQFNFTSENGDGSNWYLQVAEGECSVGEGTVEDATATVTTQEETWIGMITGEVDGMAAFASGKLQLGGNIGDLMRLQSPNLFKRD